MSATILPLIQLVTGSIGDISQLTEEMFESVGGAINVGVEDLIDIFYLAIGSFAGN
ncbi:hypothetical protein ACFTSD_18705 [Nocardiaceae bacterium NPDC056970]